VAPSSGVTEREIVKRAVKNIGPDATIYHDDYCTYGILDGSFKHESVNHSAGEYVRGDVHTNTIEGEFSVLRPWLQTFRGISKEGERLPLLRALPAPQEQQGPGQGGGQGSVHVLPATVNRRCVSGQRAPAR